MYYRRAYVANDDTDAVNETPSEAHRWRNLKPHGAEANLPYRLREFAQIQLQILSRAAKFTTPQPLPKVWERPRAISIGPKSKSAHPNDFFCSRGRSFVANCRGAYGGIIPVCWKRTPFLKPRAKLRQKIYAILKLTHTRLLQRQLRAVEFPGGENQDTYVSRPKAQRSDAQRRSYISNSFLLDVQLTNQTKAE